MWWVIGLSLVAIGIVAFAFGKGSDHRYAGRFQLVGALVAIGGVIILAPPFFNWLVSFFG